MAKDINEKLVFGVAQSPEHLGPGVTLMLGVPAKAWEYMKDGKTHNLDLSSIGLPIQVILFGADDHDAAMRVIEEHNRSLGIATLDERRRDFDIKPKPEKRR